MTHPEATIPERFREIITCLEVAIPTGIMASLLWLGHTWATVKKQPDIRQTIGGMMLSAFVAWFGCMILMSSGMVPQLSAPMAALIGAAGQKGYDYFLKKVMKDQ